MSVINAVRVKDTDSCVTVTVPVNKGDLVSFQCGAGKLESVIAKEPVPVYHKVAITSVEKGGFVYKYGEKIGVALSNIEHGAHVHIHNMRPVGFAEEA